MLNNELFFDHVSEYYDDMIGFDKALVNRKAVLKTFIRPNMSDAVDLGCGTGLDSLSLALNGLNVTSFDISEGMLEQAAIRADEMDVIIDFNKSSLPDIPESFHDKYNLAVSLGNTLAIIDRNLLKSTISKAYSLLKNDGEFLLQILNFPRLIKNSERIINITRSTEKYFIRFYDFLDDSVDFNILSYEVANPKKHDLVTTKLYPYSVDEIIALLKEAGFTKNNIYGSLSKSQFESEKSNDVVILAEK